MKPYMYVTHNEGVNENAIFGSSLIGYIKCSYQELIDAFGEPLRIDLSTSDGKTDVEWEIEFQDGTYLHIYNWKNGKNYLGEEGLEVEDMTEWNVGGHTAKDLEKLKLVFQINKIKALVCH